MAEAPVSNVDNDVIPRLKFKITEQGGRDVRFAIRRCAPMKRALLKYCQERDHVYNTVRFFIDGSRFNHNKTPDELGLEDGVQIDAMMQMLGGGKLQG